MATHDISVAITANASGAISTINSVKKATQGVSGTKVSNDGMDTLAASAQSATAKVKGTEAAVEALSSSLKRTAAAAAGAFTVSKILGFGKAALEASANMELLRKGLTFQLGAEQADSLITKMKAIGESSAYDGSALIPMARLWVNVGDNAETAVDKMKMIVDAGSAYGLTQEQIGNCTLALTQMAGAGKIDAENMNQLTNDGIPAWQLLADAMGMPVEQLRDMASKGDLTADSLNALWDGLTSKTAGASATMESTLMAHFTNLEESAQNSMAGIGDIISQAFDVSGILESAGEYVDQFKEHIQSINDVIANGGNPLQAILDEISSVSPLMGEVANTAVAAIETVANAFQSVKGFIEENGTAIATLVTVVGTYAGTAAVVAKVAAAFQAVKAAIDGARLALIVFWTIQKAVTAVSMLNPYIAAFAVIMGLLVLLASHWDEVKAAAQRAWEAVSDAASAAWDTISGIWDSAAGWFEANVWGPVSSAVDSVETAISDAFQSAYDTVTGIFGGLAGWFSDNVIQPIKRAFNSITDIGSSITGLHVSASGDGDANGGPIDAFAGGGRVRGSGGGKSDFIPAMLSNGEYVMTADARKRYEPILKAMNAGRFADGGAVGAISSFAGGNSVQLNRLIDKITAALSRRDALRKAAEETRRGPESDGGTEDAAKAQQEAAAKAQEATADAQDLISDIQESILDTDGFKTQADLFKQAKDIAGKKEQLAAFEKLGADKDTLNELTKQLAAYQDAMETKRQQDRKDTLDAYSANYQNDFATSTHDYKAQADAQYAITKLNLDKERRDKEKELMEDANDWKTKEIIALDYYAKLDQAQETYRKAVQKSHKDYISYLQDEGDFAALNNDILKNGAAWDADAQLEGWKAITKSLADYAAAAHESYASYAAKISDELYSTMGDSLAKFIQGTETAKNVFRDFGDSVLSMMAKIAAQRLAANWMTGILGGIGGMLGGKSAAKQSFGWTGSVLTGFDKTYFPMAKGGIVTAPTLAMIGEAGDNEAVIPLNSKNLSAIGGGKGGGVVVNITNKTNSNVRVDGQSYDDQMQRWVLNVVVDGASRNVGGFGRNLKTALGGQM